MRRRLTWFLPVVVLFAACALVAFFGGRGGSRTVTRLALGLAALTAALAGLAAALTWWGNRAGGRYQESIHLQQAEMAGDIRRLAELTESSLDEARAQKPEPAVHWLLAENGGSTDSVILRRESVVRPLDVEAIVSHERRLALQTLPPVPKETNEPGLLGIGALLATQRAFESPFNPSVTIADRETFAKSVDKYEQHLRRWLTEFDRHRHERRLIFEGWLRFENDGRVPGLGVIVQLHFPDEFVAVEKLPKLNEPPDRPKFRKRSILDGLGMSTPARLDVPGLLSRMPSAATRSNVSSPRYRKGSTIVEYRIEKLLHGVPEDSSESFLLRVEADGEYTIPWEIHAENLQERVRGELGFVIETSVEDGEPFTTLEEMLPSPPVSDGDDD